MAARPQSFRRFPKASSNQSLRIVLSALLASTALVSPALADPDNCTASGTTYLCEGDQSGGVQVGVNSGVAANATEVVVKDLTALSNNAPYTGPFLWLEGLAGSVTRTFELLLGDIPHVVTDSGQRNVSIDGKATSSGQSGPNLNVRLQGSLQNKVDREVVELQSFGHAGNSGTSPENKNGRPGETGGAGGDVAIILSQGGGPTEIDSATGDTAFLVLTQGGNGGNGGKGGTNSAFNQVSRSGGAGAVGGQGGAIYLTTEGEASVRSLVEGMSLTSLGGNSGRGGDSNASDSGTARGGQGAAGSASGAISFDRDADGNDSTGSWNITSSESARIGVNVRSIAGNGGLSGKSTGEDADVGGTGGTAGIITFGNALRTIGIGTGSTAVSIYSQGGAGGGGGETTSEGKPGAGGDGGQGSQIDIDGRWDITGSGTGSTGIVIVNNGGAAGTAGKSPDVARPGGTGGAGGQTTIVTSGASSITTAGTGISLSSTGGAGGGGNDVSNESAGNGGTGGAGGAFLLDGASGQASTGAWTIKTTDDSSPGIFLQSVGGVGGNGARTGSSNFEKISGAGGDGGSGGNITLSDAGTRKITTSGNEAHAVSAVSTGAMGGTGGGANGDASAGFAGFGGDGGAIVIGGEFDINTSATGSYGINAISQGGLPGSPAENPLAVAPGSGGRISVVTGAGGGITTTGSAAHGIYAASRAGQPEQFFSQPSAGSGAVAIEPGADVSATGDGSYGVYAESTDFVGDLGSGAPGKITITLPVGVTVTGGSGDGSGIYVKNGDDANTLTNNGTIASVSGKSGTAIVYDGSAKLKVTNNGTITGSTNLGDTEGEVTFDNRASGIVNAGDQLEVESFTNRGLLVTSASGTVISGDFVQSGSGVTQVALRSGEPAPLVIGGAADIAGAVGVSLASLGALDLIADQTGSFEILRAEGGLALDDDVEALPSVVARFGLDQPSATQLDFTYDLDFANDDIKGETNDSQDRLVEHLQRLFLSGDLVEGAPEEALQLLAVETSSDFAEAADSLSGEVYANTQLSTLNAAQAFGDALMSCSVRGGEMRFVREGQCAWFYSGGGRFDQDSNDTSTGFSQDSYVITGGAQFEVAPDTHLGFGLGYQNSSLDMDAASAEGDTYQIGVVAKRRFGAAMLGASVSAGTGSFDTSRRPVTGGRASGSQDVWSVSGQLRGAYTFERGDWYATPRLDLGVDYVNAESFDETGSSNLTLRVDGSNETYVSLQPAVEIGGETSLENGVLLRPTLTAGLTQYISGDGPGATSAFEIAPASDPGFRSEAEFDRTYVELAAGLEVFTSDRISISADVITSFSQNSDSYGGTLRLEWTF